MSSINPASPARDEELAVQVVGPEDGWVLEGLARTLAAKLPYAEFVPWRPAPKPATRLVYYVNYALLEQPSGCLDVVFFTHPDEAHHSAEKARRADACVCMARQYADWLMGQGVPVVAHIPMGFDSYRYRPRLILAVVGRLEHPRKGRGLLDQVQRLPFVEVVTTEGRMTSEDLQEVYERADYVLITATVEGGPLCLLEGLGVGKPIIVPEGVGVTPEFGPCKHILLYPAGDGEGLVRVVTECFKEKQSRARLVQDRSWDRWAEHHHHFFVQLLRTRSLQVPIPVPGFRFGMLGELEVPPRIHTAALESALDLAARHLFFGRGQSARTILEEAARRYPFVETLLDTIPTK